MTIRIIILSVCFLAGTTYLAYANRSEVTMIRQPLAALPIQINGWQGREAPFDDRVLQVLRVDDYVSRFYHRGERYVGLYVGFYKSQREGSSIHSPLNCLPGAGWNPVRRTTATISVQPYMGSAESRDIEVNRITIQKGLDRQVVLYWYQAHSRVVASEYWGKIYTVVDAMRLNRTDAAMIRVIVPVTSALDEKQSEEEAIAFVKSVFPLLTRHLPE